MEYTNMEYTTLSPNNDPMGAAIRDYQSKGKASRLRVLSSMFDEDEMPVAHLFRTFNQMPRLEQKALSMAKGRVLDIGAGAGCHALALQERGLEVKAIDISPLSCEVMSERGVRQPFRPATAGKIRHSAASDERHGHCRKTKPTAHAAQPTERTAR